VWATQISCLNDHTEFRYSVGLVRDAVRPFLDSDNTTKRFLANKILKGLEDDAADRSQFFVFCVSENDDDLSQWRAYGGGEGGIAIGFYERRLHPNLEGMRKLVKVCYDREDQDELVRQIVDKTFVLFIKGLPQREWADHDQWADAFLDKWRDEIIFFAPMMKHHGFEKEGEWRLLYSVHQSDVPRLKFRQRQNLMSCHVPMHLGEKPLLPIKEVLIGPCRHKRVSWASASRLLNMKGYPVNGMNETDPKKVTIRLTDVPFQNA